MAAEHANLESDILAFKKDIAARHPCHRVDRLFDQFEIFEGPISIL